MPPNDTPPATIEDWIRRPPSFIFADHMHTLLIWDTEEGGGVITKHGIGEMPTRHAEAVIKVLMLKVEELGKELRVRKVEKLEKALQRGNKRQRTA